jgi:hypothetical protein
MAPNGQSTAGERSDRAHAPAQGSPERLRCYANDVAIEFSLSEIELRFGQRFALAETPTVHTWIVTSPVHLVTFGRVIATTIAAYESRYGVIPTGAGAAREAEEP